MNHITGNIAAISIHVDENPLDTIIRVSMRVSRRDSKSLDLRFGDFSTVTDDFMLMFPSTDTQSTEVNLVPI